MLFYGQRGVLVSRISEVCLEFVASPAPSHRPSLDVVAHLSSIVRDREIDAMHAYEWPPALECYLASRRTGVPVVATVMSMAVAPFLPRYMPLVVGTEQIAAVERRAGRRRVEVVEPPVDTEADHPEATVGLEEFRSRWLPDERPTIVSVTRLVPQLKLEGLLTAIEAVARANQLRPIRLVIVGDGAARDQVEERARWANNAAGPGTVILTGALADPRPAYAAADLALGMGGSALRALAFAKPLIVQGEEGFFKLVTPANVSEFLWSGWYGVGGHPDPTDRLANLMVETMADTSRMKELGAFGRELVECRYSSKRAAARQEAILKEAVLDRAPGVLAAAAGDLAASLRFGSYYFIKRIKRFIGLRSIDDFNAHPVVRAGPQPLTSPRAGSSAKVWLWFPGVWWDGVDGTDKHLARAMAQRRKIIWVDPPLSCANSRARGRRIYSLTELQEGILRVSSSQPTWGDPTCVASNSARVGHAQCATSPPTIWAGT